nr:shikimate kinase [Saccharofermentans sp.]
INYENVYEKCSDANIIVNCTPVGMFPDIEKSPVKLDKFGSLEAVADIIYNPSRTRLLYDAEKLGLKTAGGLKMLVAQAFKASSFFLGASDDEEAVRRIREEDIARVTSVLEDRMRNITVIGMPGSGKTKFAEALGVHLGRTVIDLDEEYTKEFGETPAQTISNKGEDEFRRNETEVAGKFLSRSRLIISCGGGIVVRDENHFLLKCNSKVLYNERPLDVLCMSGRPLSAGQGVENLYKQRKDRYESLADVVIHVDAKDSSTEYIEEAVRLYDENTCT